MTDCSLFIKKWFDKAEEKIAAFKKSGEEYWVYSKFMVTSNNSQGNVLYATCSGISPFLGSVLYYSSKTEGVNRLRAFYSVNIGNNKPLPQIECLSSHRRVGKRIIPLDLWAPYDTRQPFDIEKYLLLYLSVSNLGDENILVNGEIQEPKTKKGTTKGVAKARKKTELIPRKFKFIAGCLNENILYGLSDSTAFLISFNGLGSVPMGGRGYYPGDKPAGKTTKGQTTSKRLPNRVITV